MIAGPRQDKPVARSKKTCVAKIDHTGFDGMVIRINRAIPKWSYRDISELKHFK